MSISARLVDLFSSKRQAEIDNFRKKPAEVQQEQFRKLIESGALTRFGDDHHLSEVKSVEDFRQRVPVCDYDTIKQYINRAREGEESVLWPGVTRWFAKSSGTTSDSSKYIPVTEDGLRDSHMRGPKDVACFVATLYPDTKAYDGKTLTLGGSHKLDPLGKHAQSGDLSSILIENTPSLAKWKRVPSVETALIPDFEQKVIRICEETIGKRITAFAGVPSWNLVMINKILEYTGKKNLLEVWPDLELFVHGGMSFEPYREQYRKLIPSPTMKYMETYNASEGFFAIQDDPRTNDMLLMLDYGTFYEFLPVESLDDPSKAVTLADVKPGVNYAMIITTSNGLWRYMIGDTVEFTSVTPHKIRITGRTKLFINAFGEEVIIDNAERAMKAACEASGASVLDYTAGPLYMSDGGKGGHEWLIEFSHEPEDMNLFSSVLDRTLQQVNSDYEAKRFKDTTLYAPVVRALPRGAFYRWMEQRGKLGGQNKVPRLYNTRKYIGQLLEMNDMADDAVQLR